MNADMLSLDRLASRNKQSLVALCECYLLVDSCVPGLYDDVQAKWKGKTPKNRRKLRHADLHGTVNAVGGDTVTMHA